MRSKGFTITEIMMSLAVMGIIMAMTLPIFKVSNKGFVSSEMHNFLKESSQSTLNRIANKLVQCKRIFEESANDSLFKARTGVAPATGSIWPRKHELGTLSPKNEIDRSYVGNSLLFTSFNEPLDLLVTATTSVTAPQGFLEPMRLDTYNFNYYYLKPKGTGLKLGDKEALDLWEWKSISYVDYLEIASIKNFTKSTNTVSTLYAMGYAYAWHPSTDVVTDAFYKLYSTGTISRDAYHNIPMISDNPMIKFLSGVLGTYSYGVSPNSGTLDSKNPVPIFAKESGDFPGGFEVQVTGNAMARQVFLRLVLMGKSSGNTMITRAETSLTSTRDLW